MLPDLLPLDRRLCLADARLLESATCLQAVNPVNVSRWKVERATEPPSNTAMFLVKMHRSERGMTSDSSMLYYFQVGRG